jgi:hypothetical protein
MKVISVCISVVSLVIESFFLISLWLLLGFDSRISCEGSTRSDEWISCMQGISHLEVIMSEIAVGSWLVAGAAIFAARSLPPNISLVVPGSLAAICLWWMIHTAHMYVPMFGPIGLSSVMSVYLAGPAAGA